MAIPTLAAAPFCCHHQLLSTHSCCCQLLLAFTPPINGWLLHPSLLHCSTLLSAAPIIDTFVAGRRAILFSICAILFSIAPLPSSMVVIPPTTAFNPCTLLCPFHSLVWLSLICPGWLLCCILSCRRHLFPVSCLPVPSPVVLLLTLIVRPDWLLHCRLRLSLRHWVGNDKNFLNLFV
jgi:hypothetical protein